MGPVACALAVALALAGAGKRTDAAERKRERAREHAREQARAPVEIPIDVGVGPILLVPNAPLFSDQPVFTGLTLHIEAVIDKELIRKNRDRIPRQWRGAARNLNELRVRPWWMAFIPEELVISPALFRTGMYGAVWRPLGAGLTFFDAPVRLAASAAIDVAYLFIHSSAVPAGRVPAGSQSITHFLRPGLNLTLLAELPITESFLVSTGWSSDVFVPQPLGGAPWEIFPLQDALWHLGGPFLEVHFRFPYRVTP